MNLFKNWNIDKENKLWYHMNYDVHEALLHSFDHDIYPTWLRDNVVNVHVPCVPNELNYQSKYYINGLAHFIHSN